MRNSFAIPPSKEAALSNLSTHVCNYYWKEDKRDNATNKQLQQEVLRIKSQAVFVGATVDELNAAWDSGEARARKLREKEATK